MARLESYYTTKQALRSFTNSGDAITRESIYAAIRRGSIRFIRVSERCYLLARADVDAWKARRAKRATRRQARLMEVAK
jgi:excisionase family DNA binding protein